LFRAEEGFSHLAHLGRFGLNKGQREALLDSGLLRTIVPRDGLSKKLNPPIRTRDVEELMKRFLSSAEPVAELSDGLVGLNYISKEMPGAIATVHEMILDGSIWVGRLTTDPLPYSSILVCLEEVRSLLAPGLLDTREFAKATRLHYQLVVALAKAKDIPSVVGLNPAGRLVRRSFEQSAADEARSRFIDLTELSKLKRRKPATVLQALHLAGISPLHTGRDSDGEYRVYLRKDVESLAI
jgi:hypothetical protein